jgi:two-component system, NtrC family, sensor kinase
MISPRRKLDRRDFRVELQCIHTKAYLFSVFPVDSNLRLGIRSDAMVLPLPRYTHLPVPHGPFSPRRFSPRRLWRQILRFWTRSNPPSPETLRLQESNLSITELYERSQRQTQREQLINHITNQTRQSFTLELILSEAIAQLLDALQLDRCLVHLVHQSGQSDLVLDAPPQLCTANGHIALRRQTLFEVHREPYDPSIETFDTQGPITQWVIQHRQPVMIVDTAEDTRIGYHNLEYQQNQVRSSLVVPVMSGQRLYAILYLNQCQQTRTWSKDDQKLAQSVADQLALSIQQAILYHQAQQQAIEAAEKSQQLEKTLSELQQTQAQLLQSEKMSSLGRVVAGFAHEINNPVGFIYGNLPYLENYLTGMTRLMQAIDRSPAGRSPEVENLLTEMDYAFVIEDMPRILRSMRSGAERIRQVVLSLRNFSRLDEAVRKPADLHIGIENTVLMLQNQLHDREITLRREYSELPLVDCYPGHLNQVFMNLLLNAIEALESSQQTNPVIIISTQVITQAVQEGRTTWVRIAITDNGPGIADANQSKIFDPFFTTKRSGEGMGLGLSVCYQTIINQHRGKLWIDSKLGQGSTFTLEIPCQPLGSIALESPQDPEGSLSINNELVKLY